MRSCIKLSVYLMSWLIFTGEAIAQSRVSNCDSYRPNFVFNRANINALIALSCSTLSHIENERRSTRYEDSATMFHQWETQQSGNEIRVKGYCALPLPSLKQKERSRHEIDLKFIKLDSEPGKQNIQVKGKLVGKTMNVGFSNNEFIDRTCPRKLVKVSQLESVSLGLSVSIQALFDIFNSQRTGTILSIMESESWVQGKSDSFEGLGVTYQMPLWSGQIMTIAMTSGDADNLVYLRSGPLMDYIDSASRPFFEISKDRNGVALGFSRQAPTNHKFQAYGQSSSAGAMVGCTSLLYKGGSGQSQDVDLEYCKEILRKNYVQE